MKKAASKVKKVKATKLMTPPFKEMRKMDNHSESVYDCTSVLFPDGKTKLITCSYDKTFQIFDLETLKCEKIVDHTVPIFSVLFNEEEKVLMTTDYSGQLVLWNLFSSGVKIVRRMQVSRNNYSYLNNLTQMSSNFFFCCVSLGISRGSLYSINFNKKFGEVEDIRYPGRSNKKEGLHCIYKLKREKNTILFSGAKLQKYNFVTKEYFRFRNKSSVNCITSFINEKFEEIILSGSSGRRRLIRFWTLGGKKLKEIRLEDPVQCFLSDVGRKNIYFTTATSGYRVDSFLFSLNLITNEVIKNVEKIHLGKVECLKWIETTNDKEKQQYKFVSCSEDSTFNIFELKKLPMMEKEDFEERISFIKNEEFVLEYFCSENEKNTLFSVKLWNNFEMKNIFKSFLVNF